MWAEMGGWKPLLGALVLPPVPFLLLILLGACLLPLRRAVGWFMVALGVMSIWLSGCSGAASWIQNHVLKPPPAVRGSVQARLTGLGHPHRGSADATGRPPQSAAIVVLGGGLDPMTREYGFAVLSPHATMRLQYGVWLSRQTGLPLALSGGYGWAQRDLKSTPPEADTAAALAELFYGVQVRWKETASADTRQNAERTVAMLGAAGVGEIVLVTHAWHMPRARRAFEQASADWSRQAGQPALVITPAPMGFLAGFGRFPMDWVPSPQGLSNVRFVCHEVLGLLAGA